jgi:Na+/melibiose symporter-like transporter
MLALNYLLAFVVELAALAAYALWGWGRFDTIATAAPAALASAAGFALLWALFAAPKSSHRLGPVSLLLFKIAVFAGATAALASAGHQTLAFVFAAAAAMHLTLALALGAL